MASCVENPPPRSSAAGERGGTSGTIESVRPSAPAWTVKNKVFCVTKCREKRGEEQAPVVNRLPRICRGDDKDGG